ncbi:MAG: tetratricopeptide repeat protein [Candidatus Aminicenantes bacterium]|nr:tetratricopeptide repeat protein [Candidatus Aminicenantes bacterium]
MRYKGLFYLLAFFLFGYVSMDQAFVLTGSETPQKDEKPEIISPLGKKLYAHPAQGEELTKLEEDLRTAAGNLEADPENPENIIMYGRRLAYLWRYHDAIDVYSKGITEFPDNAMLYRHRGHRYISIRDFDKAVDDMTKASQLNDHDFDIWYHLGLAHYLKGNFENALQAYRACLMSAEDDDAKIAISNWIYITLRRQKKNDEADKILERITEGMEVVENQSYYDLLSLYKGVKSESEMEAAATGSALDLATVGYGMGAWYLYNGNERKAKEIFEKIVETEYWPAFGYIAAETELVRMKQ